MARPKRGPELATDGQSDGKVTNKMEGVRRALSTLGNDAKPLDIQAFLKKEFKIDMAPSLISVYKSTIHRKPKKRGPKPGFKRAAAAAARGMITLADIQAVKELTGRLGADKVLELADVLR